MHPYKNCLGTQQKSRLRDIQNNCYALKTSIGQALSMKILKENLLELGLGPSISLSRRFFIEL